MQTIGYSSFYNTLLSLCTGLKKTLSLLFDLFGSFPIDSHGENREILLCKPNLWFAFEILLHRSRHQPKHQLTLLQLTYLHCDLCQFQRLKTKSLNSSAAILSISKRYSTTALTNPAPSARKHTPQHGPRVWSAAGNLARSTPPPPSDHSLTRPQLGRSDGRDKNQRTRRQIARLQLT